jgi:type IV pilus assembly protein PilC
VRPIPIFLYRARTENGAQVTGYIEVPSKAVATVRLRQQGLWIESLVEARPGAARGIRSEGAGTAEAQAPRGGGEIRWSPLYGLWPVSSGALGNFFEQLAGLYRAGVGMETIMGDLAGRLGSLRLEAVVRTFLPRIGQGETLSACLRSYPQVFSAGTVGLVKVGETTGNLDAIARDLADEYYAEQRVWWWLLGPRLYFAVVLILAALVESFPWFISKGLPWWFDHVVHHVVPWVGLVVAALLLYRVLWHLPPLFGLKEWLALHLPIWSTLTRRTALARFIRSVEICVRAGIEFPEAVALSAESTGNRWMTRRLARSAQLLREGVPLDEALAQARALSPSDLGILSSAARGGTFDETLPRLAQQLKESRNTLIRTLRVGGLVFAYLMVGTVVAIAAGRGYLAVMQAQMDKVEELLK